MSPVPDPRSAPPLRWGILGAGGIAGKFSAALHANTRSRVVAVGSRDPERAGRFATAYGIDRVHADYVALCEDDSVEAVYVATPHSRHLDDALVAIAAGKHVLVEKAFTRNVSEAKAVFDAAQQQGVFVMEAMWTRFLPHVAALHELVESGEIGELVNVSADHGQWFAFDAAHRLFDPALAGGALLDLGVYPVSFAHDFLGAPASVNAVGTLTETQVDAQVARILNYPGDVQATLHTTLLARTPTIAALSGTEGFVRVDGSFYRPTSFTVERRGAEPRTVSFVEPHGLHHEAVEVAIRVAEGATQSPRRSGQDTLDVLGTMDEVRAQVGLTYPGEAPRS
jgi:predicted dehydrogenase